ncbi:T9SS type A sorting domain-containing protein [Wenyingzhuangia sp. IMCC45574]
MRKKLLFGFLIGGALLATKSNAQILNADAFGFELTNVVWTTGSNLTASPGNVVQSWSQVAGFEQSNEEAHSGTYSMKYAIDYTDANPIEGKLQTWRSNTNKEGSFSLTERDYLVSAWVKVTSGTQPSALNLPIKGAGVNIDISGVSSGVWTKVYKVVTTTANADLGDNKNWMTVNYTGTIPASGTCTIYLDDITIVEYNGVQSFTTEEYLGFEGADAEIDGIIEPASNGNSSSTGWFIQHDTYFSFSDVQANSGDYSIKFDSSDGAGTKQIQGGYNTPGTSLISFAAGDYVVQADVFIPSGKSIPSKMFLNVKANTESSPATSFKSVGIDIDQALAKDTWHTITSSIATFGQTTDAGYTFRVEAADATTVAYFDNLRWTDASTLSTATSKIEGASVATSNGNITVVGANLDAVYSVSGQEVKATDLSSGIYVVKISKGNKQDTIKVVM